MRLLIDTTYLLPAIGVAVKGLPADAPIKLLQKGHEIFVSDISIFELSAIGAKQIVAGTLPAERVTRGIKAIVHTESITMISFHESTLLLTAFKLRNMLSDFIDCLILSSAINHCETLITEDNNIQNLKKNEEFNALIAKVNPRFKIQTLTETL